MSGSRTHVTLIREHERAIQGWRKLLLERYVRQCVQLATKGLQPRSF